MTGVVAQNIVLSDSNFRSRPDFGGYFLSDANANGNSVQQIEGKRRERQMKFPPLSGRKDVDSFQKSATSAREDSGFKKWNDEGDHRPDGPSRSSDNIVDPVSGFVSVAGDVDRNTGHYKIKSMVQLNTTPQASIPQSCDTIRVKTTAPPPPELCRVTDRDPGGPYPWNGRKVLDATLRAQLGGWTSDRDPRSVEDNNNKEQSMSTDPNRELRDKLALEFMYKSSTQRSYEDVPWDSMLPPRKWPPVSTMEERPDMISQRWTNKRYAPAANEWQNTGRSWDWFQPRKGYHRRGPQAIVFSSQCPREQHIPLYSGCVGAENLDEIDNREEPFKPFTVKRVTIPRYIETGHRPNIPGYNGCTLFRSNTMPAHAMTSTPEPTTTTRTYRSLPATPNDSVHKRDSQMSKMVTLVPPCNPFNLPNKDQSPPATSNKPTSATT